MAANAERTIRKMYDLLLAAYGSQGWWPGNSALEVVVGAILAQNTAWKNVERAIENLGGAGCLSWSALRDISHGKLARLVQPSGTFRVKARRLKAFVKVLWDDHGGSLDSLLAGDVGPVRDRLLAIHGVGPETADAILLYAGEKPIFVVDAYTKRILRRHGLITSGAGYNKVQNLFQHALSEDARLFNEYHALLVAVGKHHCKTRPQCAGCPLADLPHECD
ncbi:MAG: hypothetical protein JSU63_04550 [Phycisphaerales bacterium]|nr:MAG: hypothetical protein JSU63_04550 [Phycisphaerales bacterium]